MFQSSAIEIKAVLASLGTGPAALATLVSVLGSSYRQPGARCLLLPDGRTAGSISGGCLEEDVRIRARQVLENGETQLVLYDTAAEIDLMWGTGLGCQGQVRVFIERLPAVLPAWVGVLRDNFNSRRETALAVVYEQAGDVTCGTRLLAELADPPGTGTFIERIAPPPSLVVFGAGDDAMPLVRLASQLGWHVTLFDVRPAYATAARFPEADAVFVAAGEDASRLAAIDAGSHVVVMSHRYRDDLAALRWLLPRPLAYLGILGPHRRTGRILDELREEGLELTGEIRERLYAPVGIDLGGASPESVALSIVAELQACRSKRIPQHLRDSTRPIHD